MSYSRAVLLVLLASAVPGFAQTPSLSDGKPFATRDWALPSIPVPGCLEFAGADTSFRARTCYELKRIVGTGVLLRSFAQSGFSEWRSDPRSYDHGRNEFSDHLRYFYTRRAANTLGEWVAGSLNHEPLAPGPSGRTGFWDRAGSAVLGVVTVRDENGWRPAFAPLTGSLASGFVTMGCCAAHNGLNDALGRATLTYAGYFATAVFREFKPELKSYASHKFKRFN